MIIRGGGEEEAQEGGNREDRTHKPGAPGSPRFLGASFTYKTSSLHFPLDTSPSSLTLYYLVSNACVLQKCCQGGKFITESSNDPLRSEHLEPLAHISDLTIQMSKLLHCERVLDNKLLWILFLKNPPMMLKFIWFYCFSFCTCPNQPSSPLCPWQCCCLLSGVTTTVVEKNVGFCPVCGLNALVHLSRALIIMMT